MSDELSHRLSAAIADRYRIERELGPSAHHAGSWSSRISSTSSSAWCPLMHDVVARLNTVLEDRYRIERELGQGGMATVYLAQDLRHDCNVAV